MPSRLPELDALNSIRLNHDWSIRDLAVRMKAHGCPVGERTLHDLLMKTRRRRGPFDRTLYKIRVYLAHLEQLDEKARQKKLRAQLAKAAAIRASRGGAVEA